MATKKTNEEEKKEVVKKTTTKKTEEKKETKKEPETNKTITGLDEKYEVILVYLISILGFIFSLMKDKKVSKNIKFHYNQAGTIWLVNIVIMFATRVGGLILSPISWISFPVSVLLFVVTLVALVKAYNGEKYEIPVINDLSKSIWGNK